MLRRMMSPHLCWLTPRYCHPQTLSIPHCWRAAPWPLVTSSMPKRFVEIVEEEVSVVLGDVGDGDPKRWIFDTEASYNTPPRVTKTLIKVINK
jgi:aspartyl/asparaginyl beta-hydroxylase (cupin superfamily)